MSISSHHASGECDHSRGRFPGRSSAITVCRHCRDYLCSICGVTIDWYEGLCVTNPMVQWRYCAKGACIDAEAAYHALSLDEMIQRRGELRGKRVLVHLQDRGIEPQPPSAPITLPYTLAALMSRPRNASESYRAEVVVTPIGYTRTLDPGEACWCNLGKDCGGDHEIGPVEVVNVCGLCGQTFRIAADDPHWSTGEGPVCPGADTKERSPKERPPG